MIINKSSKSASVQLAGGKGYSLFKLARGGFSVPSFFVVTTKFFEEFLKFNNLKEKIEQHFKRNEFDAISKLITSGEFSPLQRAEIEENLRALGANKLSVRSSCSFEDSKDHSCAGQLKTFLNVSPSDALKNIKKCFAGYYSSNLKQYMKAEDFEKSSMAVVIQTMIDADISGVCFSTDFVNQNKDFCIVEAVRGLGEKLVSGMVTPTKFIVRKSNNFIEIKEGNLKISDAVIEEVSRLSGEIEKLYKMPMDIEWCMAGSKIYILQARPIVGTSDATMNYAYVMSRPRPLSLMQIVQMQSLNGLKWLLDGNYYFKPVHLFISGHFEEYTNMYKIEENPNCMIKFYGSKCKDIDQKLSEAVSSAKKVDDMVCGRSVFDFKLLLQCFIKFGACNTFANLVEQTTNVTKIENKLSPSLKNKTIKFREYFDEVKYRADEFLMNYLKMTLPAKLYEFVNVMTIDEAFGGKKVSERELKRRLGGFAYFDGQIIYPEQYDAFFASNFMKIVLKGSENAAAANAKFLSGSVAFSGIVRGKVKIVFSENDLKKVKKGDIIVSAMTVPTYIEAMKIAGGIVTDEGGTVCHAALISRELKKPCIVGTKLATVVLKDDMLVEINTDDRKVYILS